MSHTVMLTASASRSLAVIGAALLLAGACSSSNPAGTPGTAGTSPTGDAAAGSTGAAGTNGVDGGSAGTGIPKDGPPTSLWSLTPAATPATVTFTRETSSKVVKEVPLAGGTLSTVAKDGTKFDLTIPGDALFSPQTIAMTPVLITAHPFSDDPAWGVELLPDGLAFNKAVTLVITPPGTAPPVDQQVPFGWSGANNAVFLANPDPKDAHLALKLLHFSSYAYATARLGTSASLAGVRNRLGGSAQARFESAAAELLGAARQKALLGVPQENVLNSSELAALWEEYERDVVQVRVAAAGESCAAGRLAVETVLGVARQKSLLGFAPESIGLPVDLIETMENVCLDEEWALCRDHHIIQRMIPLVLGMERQHQLLGAEAFSSNTTMKALTYLYKCLQFELEVSSTTGTTCDEWMFTEPVKGLIKLKLNGSKGAPTDLNSLLGANIEGTEALRSLSYTIGYSDNCSKIQNIIQRDPTFIVSALAWSLKEDPTEPGKGEIKDFTLGAAPGQPAGASFLVFGSTHDILESCSDPIPPPQTIPEFNWYSIYTVVMGENPLYFNEQATDFSKAWYFDRWTTVYNDGGPLLAKKVVDEKIVDGGINYTAATTLLLTHKPAQ
jgi:hypothetical protein